MKTAEQAIHDILWKSLTNRLSDKVYESRPMTDVGYPFADFEDFGTNYMGTKSGALPNVSVVINIWDTEDNRKNVSNLCGILFQEAMIMSEAYGFRVALKIDESSTQITQDRTVTPPVWRGMVTLVFDIL